MPSEQTYQYSRALEWLLGKIKKENTHRKSGELWEYHFHNEDIGDIAIPPPILSYSAQQSALWSLEKSLAIRIKRVPRGDLPPGVLTARAYHLDPAYPAWWVSPPRRPTVAYFEIREPDFSRTYTKFVQESEQKEKLSILINKNKGIYRADDPSKVYKIKGAKRLQIVFLILKNESADLADIRDATNQEDSNISNEIKDINKIFRKKVLGSIDGNIELIKSGSSGYYFNEDE